ncbi:hypothetical protein PSHT_12791 [Puccinia striiformis]|uniref:Uncharacterized protein n=2 Tax=Puccinia striiformis TaxID=27350 RepID=A0A2S4VI94_9BASI|nr:hypothetical protein PSHT_12791 [Puccinia striiformis]POW09264.1 hypothetical protein PSTT_06970 [Puccinia striiformis]
MYRQEIQSITTCTELDGAAQISLEEFSSGAPRSSPPVPQGVLRQYLKEFSGEVLRQYSKEFSGEVLCQYSKEFSARTPIRIQIPLAESADKINFIGVWPPDVNFPWWATIRGSVLSVRLHQAIKCSVEDVTE